MDLPIRYDRPAEAWDLLVKEFLAILAEKERCRRAGMSPEAADLFTRVKTTFFRLKVRRLLACA
jgi:hypothetical protein